MRTQYANGLWWSPLDRNMMQEWVNSYGNDAAIASVVNDLPKYVMRIRVGFGILPPPVVKHIEGYPGHRMHPDDISKLYTRKYEDHVGERRVPVMEAMA